MLLKVKKHHPDILNQIFKYIFFYRIQRELADITLDPPPNCRFVGFFIFIPNVFFECEMISLSLNNNKRTTVPRCTRNFKFQKMSRSLMNKVFKLSNIPIFEIFLLLEIVKGRLERDLKKQYFYFPLF